MIYHQRSDYNSQVFGSKDIVFGWAESVNIDRLQSYNLQILSGREQMPDKNSTLFNLQLVLTPGAEDIILGGFTRPYSVLDLAAKVSKRLPTWVTTDYNRSTLNIVTCDFYHLFNFTDVVIQKNFQ